MADLTGRLCTYCGAPLREVVDGACPFCHVPLTPVVPFASAGGSAPDGLVDLVLVDAGRQKIQVVKAVRELTDLGLKDAKDIVDAAGRGSPRAVLARGITVDLAHRWADAVARSGGRAEIAGASPAGGAAAAFGEGPAPLVPGVRYDLLLLDPGRKKIWVIKEVRELTNLGLRETKDLVDASSPSRPELLARGLDAAVAARWAGTLTAAGAWVEARPEGGSPEISGTSPAGGAPGVAGPAPAQLVAGVRYDLFLLDPGDKKIQVIKEVRQLTNLGLKEAKDIADVASRHQPQLLARGLDATLVEQWAQVFTAAGASVEARPAG